MWRMRFAALISNCAEVFPKARRSEIFLFDALLSGMNLALGEMAVVSPLRGADCFADNMSQEKLAGPEAGAMPPPFAIPFSPDCDEMNFFAG